MAEAADSTNTISLKTASGEIFKISPATAKQMPTVQSIIDSDPSSAIPLPTINSSELSKIIDYLDRSAAAAAAIDAAVAKKEFEAKFAKELSPEQLLPLILAAVHLRVRDLHDLLNTTVAKFIENKSVEFVRKFFGIVNDYTPFEEAKFREENAWVFEGVKSFKWLFAHDRLLSYAHSQILLSCWLAADLLNSLIPNHIWSSFFILGLTNWVFLGYSCMLGICSSLKAELWSLYHALNLAAARRALVIC
ncbi:hypothetical protein RIF29_08526 [Crotalaria pallida]|uniref:SKP1 component POZ domain-containing protein n=1 Tax=Crotalaria pallida TaxID=3830 RepID=A0AAN9IHD2_CROPI